MEDIDMKFPKVKDSIQLNSTIFELCVSAEIISKDEGGGKREIQQAYQMQAKLQSELSEQRERADQIKDIMTKKIVSKVPKLQDQAEQFL